MDNTKKVVMFDASLQKDCDHTIDIDGSGEIVLTSVESGRFVKLPADTDSASLAAFIESHKAANEGQLTVEALDAKKAELIEGLQQVAPQDVDASV